MRAYLLVIVAALGCGETQLGPFQALPIDARFEIEGNDAIIHVARDRFGIAHVYAQSVADLGVAQGYVMAHDRLPQMELLRRMASGTLAEVYGTPALAIDVEMRFHRLRAIAEQQWAHIEQNAPDLATLIRRFSDGVNAYLADVHAGRWPVDPATDLDPAMRALFAGSIASWEPIDSVAIMRFYTFAQSFTALEELERTELDVKLRAAGQPAGLARDLIALAPIPGPGAATPAFPPSTANGASRPAITDVTFFDHARAFLARPIANDAMQVIDPHVFMRPYLGSSAFAVGPELTLASRTAILAADMHVALANPSIVYPMHQIVPLQTELETDEHLLDILGVFLPGVPVAIAGSNGRLGWAPTLGAHDITDIYAEDLSVPREDLRTFEATIQIANEETPAKYVFEETRHGPVIPGRPGTVGLSIAYTGYVLTHELEVLWSLAGDASVGEAQATLRDLSHGPHYMLVDAAGAHSWTSYADVPQRAPAARLWNDQSPDAAAPFFILDGDNPGHDWTGFVAREELPVRAGSYIVAADADPTGATTDGQPLDAYVGVAYASGLRAQRIATLVERATLPIDERAVTAIQHDTLSVFGERVRDAIVIALGDYLMTTTDEKITRAHGVLLAWTFETPVAEFAADANSAATLLFNTWMHFFVARAIADDLAAAQYTSALDPDRVARLVFRMLVDPSTLERHAITTDSLLCGAAGCAAHVVDAMRDAVTELDQTGGVLDWRWGRVHALKMRPLFPDPMEILSLPKREDTPLQLSGDMFSVSRSDGGWDSSNSFTPRTSVGYRIVIAGNAVSAPLALSLELPTGVVLDTRDPHYVDLFQRYVQREPVGVPFVLQDINANGESRWEFR